MNLLGLLSVSGKPGLYKMIGNRPSGLVIEPLAGGPKEFASSRQHQFTPLESIAIFTDDGESVPLKDVLKKIMEQIDDNPLPDPKSSNEQLREFMLDVLPTHDQNRVYPSDIKKLVKWYTLLEKSGKLAEEEPANDAEPESSEETSAVEEKAPKAKKAKADDAEDAPKEKKAKTATKKPAAKKPTAAPKADKGAATKAKPPRSVKK